MDRTVRPLLMLGGLGLALLALTSPVQAQQNSGAIFTQCPGDNNGDSDRDDLGDDPTVDVDADGINDSVKCKHLSAGDGFVTMADGKLQYIFSFSDLTGTPAADAMDTGALAANFPAPTIVLNEGDHFYLNVTNVGMAIRPDLSDPHSVHFHGFPNAAPIFDGTPENSISINMGSTLSYYYKIMEPGTYMYHCHVEATEHMQMGMLGNLYVKPRQNGTSIGGYSHFVYNDGDGSTGYDVEYPIQIGSFDPDFHDASETVQPLPFAAMKDRYAMLNGRGYPDTVKPSDDPTTPYNESGITTPTDRGDKFSQPVNSLVEATVGQRVLLRISNLNVTRFYTLASTIPMKVVGHNARLYRGPGAGATPGSDLYYKTNSVTLGGGEAVDVILETAGVGPGTYLVYTTNLNYLSNDGQDLGGMMTEIRISDSEL